MAFTSGFLISFAIAYTVAMFFEEIALLAVSCLYWGFQIAVASMWAMIPSYHVYPFVDEFVLGMWIGAFISSGLLFYGATYRWKQKQLKYQFKWENGVLEGRRV